MEKTKIDRIDVRISHNLLEDFKKIAKENDLPISALVRILIRNYINKHKE